MDRKTLWITSLAAAAATLGGASAAVAGSTLGDSQSLAGPSTVAPNSSFHVVSTEQDDDGSDSGAPLSAEERDKAGQAALAKVGQGQVGEVERENEAGSAYEVGIILPDGSEVDVELGADFQVLRTGAPERD
ncbi:PepSY domain-containing protein [Sinomonas mesophila]|uniref:PepSY domain-containing protein n=1 Tax=Sinomonas mesophila TaxID=1531955 RepID=UPI0009867145|nr:hypothetical protein [Sinomonas mesophila]